jgi:hypothetical protein
MKIKIHLTEWYIKPAFETVTAERSKNIRFDIYTFLCFTLFIQK